MQQAYIVDAVRTPVGKRNGAMKNFRPDDMLVHTIQSLLARNPTVDHNQIDDVVIGCAMPEAQQGLNVARISALLAGLPESTPAYTLNRFCASGLQAVANAAMMIQTGAADLVIAGGVESMSQIPMGGYTPALNVKIFDDQRVGIAYGMGLTAEKVVAEFGINQESQNQFAFESHSKAIQAQKSGWFQDEISPVVFPHKRFDEAKNQVLEHVVHVKQDEGPRPDTSIEKLNTLRPAFAANGTVSAGNSSQMSDGAACVLLASDSMLKRLDLKPVARFVQYSVVGVAPELMGIGPVEAIPAVLNRSGLSLNDIDWIELNEAFAAQSLAVIKALDLNTEVVNPLGGAIALGHPLGATGAIRLATLLSAFRRKKCRYGMITMCIGTGMGAAGVFENLV